LAGRPSTYEAVNGSFPYWLFRMGPYIKSVTTGPFYLLFDPISNFSAPYAPTVLVVGFGAVLSGTLVWGWITVLSWIGIEITEFYEGLVSERWKHVAVLVIVLGMTTAMAGVYIFSPTHLSGVEKAPLKETTDPSQRLSDESVKPWLKKYAENTTHNEIVNEFNADDSEISHLTGTDVQCLTPKVISESSDGNYFSVNCVGSVEYTYNWGLLHSSFLAKSSKQFYFVNRSVVERVRKPIYNNQVLRPGITLSNVEIKDEEIYETEEEWIDLSRSTLTNVTLRTDRSVNLAYSSLNNVTLKHENIRLVNLTGSDVRNSRVEKNGAVDSALAYTVRGASLTDTELINVSLEFAEIRNSELQNVHCYGCDFCRLTFSDVKISESVFVDSNMEGANLSDVDVLDSKFVNSSSYSSLSGSMMFTDLSEVDVSNLEVVIDGSRTSTEIEDVLRTSSHGCATLGL
jgi:uncharacterized protein YjbI with pentapeptide repeats